MIIRPATPEDVPATLPMVTAISRLHENWDRERFGLRGDVAESYRNWLVARAKDARAVFLVAEHERDRKLVGYLVGTIESEIPIYWMPECGWIHDVWIDEGYRNEGLGRQMAMLAVEKFRELGVKQIRLQTAAANDAGRKLFAACGFRVCTMEMLITVA